MKSVVKHALPVSVWLAIVVIEMLIVSIVFEFDYQLPRARNPVYLVRQLILWAILTLVAFGVLCWSRRGDILSAWQAERRNDRWLLVLLANGATFAVLVLAAQVFTTQSRTQPSPSWPMFATFCGLLAANAIALVRLIIPFSTLWNIVRRQLARLSAAAALSAAILFLTIQLTDVWNRLAGATLTLSHAILNLYEKHVQLDADRRLLGVGDFLVEIDQSCSGYEGIGLVTAFTCLYWYAFRRELKFPHALLLLPMGIVAIWLLNSLRIAVLVSLGAHVSAAVAIKGFHSQAGWMLFLAVTIAMMILSQRSRFFSVAQGREPSLNSAQDRRADRLLLACLMPFLALMSASIVAAAFAPYDHLLYGLKVASVGLVLWMFRDVYCVLDWRVGIESIVVGAAVALAWIATAVIPSEPRSTAVWLQVDGFSWLVVGWLAIRCIGTSVMVPIAEELAFRGFLHRWIISRRFEMVPQGQFSLAALIVSSLLFGLMHDRWLAGALAGVAFALVMYRTGRLSDPIAAHMIANILIFTWAVSTGKTWLLS